jgi:copper chaperone NosL
MKKLVNAYALMAIILLAVSCKIKPEPIQFGTDACYFCKMNIVERSHASQAVSSKGKQFKYDAIECMVKDITINQNSDMSIVLVSNYLNAGEMLNAEEATFIISSNIPSPMGGNLSALKTRKASEDLKNEHGGEIYDWTALKEFYSSVPSN